ncbi:hypothetical protein FE392_06735 [Xenorhabdus sp. 12]|uniref:Uncharacterized protein n=1 Tax=Xenorhabdus santafensis TaxID=2582833 RepID=A0ABU4S8A6_9GAMM|nr:hypothetical protein [Xenorhabdus sp. 12]MDX7987028.1 hypothetical protein [Xenorhabdus sp. 12]
MPTYAVQTKIESNVLVEKLFYDLTSYRQDAKDSFHILLDVFQEKLQGNNKTKPLKSVKFHLYFTKFYQSSDIFY